MNKIKEVIRLKAAGISLRPIAQSVRLSLGAVSKYAKAAADAGLTWPLPAQLTDEALIRLILGAPADVEVAPKFVAPDYPGIHQALKQKSVTPQLLWHEYRECHGEFAYSYSQFYTSHREWAARLKRSMRRKRIGRARSCSSITVGRRCRFTIGSPVRFLRRKSSWPSWALPITPMRKRPALSSCLIDSGRMCALLSLWATVLPSLFPII